MTDEDYNNIIKEELANVGLNYSENFLWRYGICIIGGVTCCDSTYYIN